MIKSVKIANNEYAVF